MFLLALVTMAVHSVGCDDGGGSSSDTDTDTDSDTDTDTDTDSDTDTDTDTDTDSDTDTDTDTDSDTDTDTDTDLDAGPDGSVDAGDTDTDTYSGLTVGASCTYATIAEAIAAATAGDTILLEGGVTFSENLYIDKDLVIIGGYPGCASGSSDRTTIDGSGTSRVMDVAEALDVTIERVDIANGTSTSEAGGIRFAAGTGTGSLTLEDVSITSCQGNWGGALWIGNDTTFVGTNVEISDNTATSTGGGVRIYGGTATFHNSSITGNTAPTGGAVSAVFNNYAPVLQLDGASDISDNQALTGDGMGGGVYMESGTILLSGATLISSNDATWGGGLYLTDSTVTMSDATSSIEENTATESGGGIHATGSQVNLDDGAEVTLNVAGGGSVESNGGGVYLDDSTLDVDKGHITDNQAGNDGGGVYGVNASTFDMSAGGYGCSGAGCSTLSGNTADHYGGGAYDISGEIAIDQALVEDNGANLGGGLYSYSGTTTVTNTLITGNDATNPSAEVGDGIRIYSGATLTADGITVAYNPAAGNGYGISGYTSTITVESSIIWGHTSSFTQTTNTVTCSDVQGGYTGAGNLDIVPGFEDFGAGDFHLSSTSDVIDVCSDGPSVDFEGDIRPHVVDAAATPYDMGADEYTP